MRPTEQYFHMVLFLFFVFVAVVIVFNFNLNFQCLHGKRHQIEANHTCFLVLLESKYVLLNKSLSLQVLLLSNFDLVFVPLQMPCNGVSESGSKTKLLFLNNKTIPQDRSLHGQAMKKTLFQLVLHTGYSQILLAHGSHALHYV